VAERIPFFEISFESAGLLTESELLIWWNCEMHHGCIAIKSSNLCEKLNRETVVSTLSGVIGGRKPPPLGCGVFRIEAWERAKDNNWPRLLKYDKYEKIKVNGICRPSDVILFTGRDKWKVQAFMYRNGKGRSRGIALATTMPAGLSDLRLVTHRYWLGVYLPEGVPRGYSSRFLIPIIDRTA
jgi:hypothetical protein